MVAETYRQGCAGQLMRCARWLTVAGATGAVVWGGRSVASAQDPKYTVVPQRSREAA